MHMEHPTGLPGRGTTLMVSAVLATALSGCLSSSDSDSSDGTIPGDDNGATGEMLPVVFVHGGAGSAAQYRTQAMRFDSNDYPRELFHAFEYHGVAPHDPEELDAFVDEVLEAAEADQIYLIGHSMGTSVGAPTGYLDDPDRAAKVAKYIGIDGFASEACPGGVPCMGIFDNDNEDSQLGENNVHLPHQEHVEVATSLESFQAQYEFLLGESPETGLVPEEEAVDISGRAVHFPENVGADGATLEIREIDGQSGARLDDEPVYTHEIDADGDWGPASLDPEAHYEIVLKREGQADHHFYHQPFERSSDFVRLNTSGEESAIRDNTNTGDDHSALIVTREREWRGAYDEDGNDILEIETTSPQWGDQAPVNVIVEEIGNSEIALHLHDSEGEPAISSLNLLDWFPDQAFQTGVDVYMPATTPPDGTVSLVSQPRGDADNPQEINVPNWASSEHRVSVIFNDYVNE